MLHRLSAIGSAIAISMVFTASAFPTPLRRRIYPARKFVGMMDWSGLFRQAGNIKAVDRGRGLGWSTRLASRFAPSVTAGSTT